MSEEKTVSFDEMMSGGEAPVEDNATQETPKEEPKKEVVDEGVKETPKETPLKEEPKPFDFGVLSEKIGREINDEESLKALFEKADKYESTATEYEQTKQQMSELSKKLDPLSYFASEDEYKRQQLLIKKGDQLGKDAIKELSVLNPSEVGNLSDVDVLKLQLMVDKGVSKEDAESYLMRKYDVTDFSDEDIEAGVKSAMKIDAVDARRQVSDLYGDIEIPNKTDIESSRQKFSESWSTPLTELKKGLDNIKITEGVELGVTDSMLESIDINGTIKELMANGIEPSEAALASIAGAWRDQLVVKNIKHVAEAITNAAIEKNNTEWRAKVHNDQPLNDGSRGEQTQTLSNDDSILSVL